MSTKFLLRSFAGGEITPELAGRLDLVKYQTGLALARNFITLPHGPAARRPGFEFINEAKDSTQAVRLIPFAFSASQTAVLEFGHQYIRFHIDGGTLLEATKAIASIAGSTVNTSSAHGYSTGDWVYIGSRYHKITVVDADTFTTADLWGTATTASGTTAARVYTIASPYAAADLFDLHYAQSADVVTITHPSYSTRELKRLGATNWTLTTVSFAAPTNAPSDLVVTATVAENKTLTTQKYVVTTVAADGVTESLPSDPMAVSNNLTLAGNYNTLTWSAVGGATRYNAYKLRGGIYGYIGQARPNTGAVTKTISTIDRPGVGDKTVTVTTSAAHGFANEDLVLIESTGVATLDGAWVITVTGASTFTYTSVTDSTDSAATGTASIPELQIIDDNVMADTLTPPPEDIIALNTGAGDYPGTTTYHEQRRWFAGTDNKPQVLWATRTGTEANLTSSVPARDADGLELRIAASQYNQIRHLVALADLIALTAGGEFRIYSDGAPAITPTSVSIKPQGYAGASNVQPVVTTGSVLYVQAQGSRLRELSYSWEANAYRTVDASIMAPHRFNGYTVTDLAYSRAPDSITWAVRDDGVLLGMTYVPDQQVYGWHAHDTAGEFESVCTVSEGSEDVLYAVVKRTVNARTVRYVERLRSRIFTAQEDAFFVDSGLTYSGSPVSTVGGLYHLEGQTVDILADGAVEARQTVTGGQVTLGTAASTVHVGLPITADLVTLPLAMEGAAAAGQGTVKNINKVHLRVSQSSVVKAGPAFDRLREYPARAVTDPYGSPPALRNGELALSIDPSWNQDAALCVRQDLPLPLTVLSMTLEIQSGG
jgi:hypothetical protein